MYKKKFFYVDNRIRVPGLFKDPKEIKPILCIWRTILRLHFSILQVHRYSFFHFHPQSALKKSKFVLRNKKNNKKEKSCAWATEKTNEKPPFLAETRVSDNRLLKNPVSRNPGPRIIPIKAVSKMSKFRKFCPDNFWRICPDWNWLFQFFFKFVRTSETAFSGPKIVRITETGPQTLWKPPEMIF